MYRILMSTLALLSVAEDLTLHDRVTEMTEISELPETGETGGTGPWYWPWTSPGGLTLTLDDGYKNEIEMKSLNSEKSEVLYYVIIAFK